MPITFYVILVNLYHRLNYGLHADWMLCTLGYLIATTVLHYYLMFHDSCVSNVYCNDLISFMISFCNVTMHTSLGLCLIIVSLFSATQ